MSYSTVTEVRAATGFNDQNVFSTATIVNYIQYGDSMIDSLVGSVYQLPLSADCPFITNTSIQIAVALLYINEYGEENQNTNRDWKRRLDVALQTLDKVRLLKMRLFDITGTELDRISTRQPSFYPTAASSAPSAVDTTKPKITMNEQF